MPHSASILDRSDGLIRRRFLYKSVFSVSHKMKKSEAFRWKSPFPSRYLYKGDDSDRESRTCFLSQLCLKYSKSYIYFSDVIKKTLSLIPLSISFSMKSIRLHPRYKWKKIKETFSCKNVFKTRKKEESLIDFYKKRKKRGSCNVAIEILKTLKIPQ